MGKDRHVYKVGERVGVRWTGTYWRFGAVTWVAGWKPERADAVRVRLDDDFPDTDRPFRYHEVLPEESARAEDAKARLRGAG